MPGQEPFPEDSLPKSDINSLFAEDSPPPNPLKIKLPPMVTTRRSERRQSQQSAHSASGSEYHEDPSLVDEGVPEEEPEEKEEIKLKTLRSGRRVTLKSYVESEEDDADFGPSQKELHDSKRVRKKSTDSDEGSVQHTAPRRNTRRQSNLSGFIESDEEHNEEDDEEDAQPRRRLRSRPSKPAPAPPPPLRRTRSRKTAEEENDYQDDDHASHGTADAEEPEDDNDGKPYALRQRAKINYAIPPPLEEMKRPPKPVKGGAKKRAGLGWSASGADLSRWMGMPAPGDDSDSDNPARSPRKPGYAGGLNAFGSGTIPAGGVLPGDLAAGTPSNLGKIGDAALADADPLGVNTNVTFDEVGGLDEHIHSLKEMTLLPLLYPEVFQRFSVTPPRGVLFHGPPGTGKTLLARALAASCRSDGRQISFFMRKGADCLSKWVGEAERQLRLLFEEARNSQPSIIFFDEIDGLAPVRSSKQDQIHASIVSTLLALMDGMDGRGQVIVIGATNRPDAVDPALRRPGRFDREFYFGLPGLDAREKILGIMTRKWANWDCQQEGPKGEQVKETLKGLAKLTKGYGGADLRALCTEAALNAIQRRYPQVYKSNDRLLLKPETIDVGLRDFMISIKKIVPSSARSATSAATTLPPQFLPLLSDSLEKVKSTIQRVMPIEKKLSALEEAEYEDEGGEEGALEREMLSQSMQTLRIYRPRVIIHGPIGMGQGYIGAASLHHLEGYHIQSLELGSLMSDSTRTVEAAIVQLFTEAKRHQPSVIYIPSLIGWCAAVNETTRSTVRAMLETLLPTDPILLLAVVDGPFKSVPKDVRAWFGASKDNRVSLAAPSAEQREAFFEPMLNDVQRPPNQFADGMARRKRVLEVLPIAPPPEPRKPTAAELAVQRDADQKTIVLLKFKLGPIMSELKRKFKRFTKRATEEYNFEPDEDGIGYPYQAIDVSAGAAPSTPNGNAPIDIDAMDTQPGTSAAGAQQPTEQVQLQLPKLYDIDLDRMYNDMYAGHYLTPQSFLDDIGRIVHNAAVFHEHDLDRFQKAQAMYNAAELSIIELFDAPFRLECERMAARERLRRQEESRDAKGKGKDKSGGAGNDNGNEQPNGITRRSTRQNGSSELLSLTDPVKLERKLKRARTNGDGADGHSSGSAGEQSGNDARDAKRSKMVGVEDDVDPMNLVATGRSVRFANQDPPSHGSVPAIVEPQHGYPSINGTQDNPNFLQHQHSGQHADGHLSQPPYQQQGPFSGPQQRSIFPSHRMQGDHGFSGQHYPQPQFAGSPMDMGRSGGSQRGFDASLLNPMQPEHQHQLPSAYDAQQYPPRNDSVFGMDHQSFISQPSQSSFLGPSQPQYPFQEQNQQHQYGGFPGGSSANSNSILMNDGMGFHSTTNDLQHLQHQPQGFHPNSRYPQPESQLMQSPPPAIDMHNPMFAPSTDRHSRQGSLQPPGQMLRRDKSRTPPPPRSPARLSKSRTPEPVQPGVLDGPDRFEKGVERGVPDESTPVASSSVEGGQGQATAAIAPLSADEDTTMAVERDPTPPLPDFHVSETLLDDLKRKLKFDTEGLNVEQLEQLRATCLGDVWRHRKEWDRDELVKALQKVVDEFLEEVREMDSDFE